MSKSIIKFSTQDNVKFVEIYRNYECLWNTQNPQYKNRDARDEALKLFAEELAIDNFGPKEIVLKIKNMRSQYLQEVKKKKISIGTGVGTEEVYTPKLQWFQLMDSFMKKVIETRPTISNLFIPDRETESNYDTQRTETVQDTQSSVEDTHVDQSSVEGSHQFQPPEKPITRKRKLKKPETNYISEALNKLDDIERRASSKDDDLSAFGNYVVSTLRKFNARNCVAAQDEIYSILSRYKLCQLGDYEATVSTSGSQLTPRSTSMPMRPLVDYEATASTSGSPQSATTPMPESPFSQNEDNEWWSECDHINL